MSLDRIEIKDLRLRCIIGSNEEERHQPQDVLLNLTLFTDTRRAGQSDDLADTVNYQTLTERLAEHVEGSHYFLLEALAASIAHLCLAEASVQRVIVQVEKPGALRRARSAGVVIERSAADG
jgi:dihydroneopterin aldolase/D-erythro-7,8-dihydroneopterin triphosphate epimerase